MAIIVPSRRVWTRQPTQPAGIDFNSNQACGLVWYPALNLPSAADLSVSRLDATVGPSTVATTYGIGRKFSGSNDIQATPNSRIANSTEWTACCFVKFDSFANSYNTVLSCAGATTGFRDLHVKSTGKLALYVEKAPFGNINYDGTGANTLATGVWYHLAITFSSSAGLIGYVNALVDGNAASGGSSLSAVSGTSKITVGNNQPTNPTRYINGEVVDARFYDRALTQREITQIYRNPWQLFAPLSSPIFYSLPSTGTSIPTLSAPTVTNITQTAATPRVTVTFA